MVSVHGSASAGASGIGGDAHVLLVDLADEDVDTAEMYSVGLRLEGFLPSVARDLDSAVRCLNTDTPRAIVANVVTPDDDTWTWLRTIHRQSTTADVPVVLIADCSDESMSARAGEYGWALLTKPCLPDALADAVRRALSPRDAQR